jgi:hypothetical protein
MLYQTAALMSLRLAEAAAIRRDCRTAPSAAGGRGHSQAPRLSSHSFLYARSRRKPKLQPCSSNWQRAKAALSPPRRLRAKHTDLPKAPRLLGCLPDVPGWLVGSPVRARPSRPGAPMRLSPARLGSMATGLGREPLVLRCHEVLEAAGPSGGVVTLWAMDAMRCTLAHIRQQHRPHSATLQTPRLGSAGACEQRRSDEER